MTASQENPTKKSQGWIGVDLDGTLANYNADHGTAVIGKPIDAMIFRVKQWLAAGMEIRIFTARASKPELIAPVQKWLSDNGLPKLAVTNRKDYDLLQLWDDRVVQIERNTATVLTPKEYIMLDINGWIGVDLDGTLAHYDIGQDAYTIGEPVTKMRLRVQQWLMVGIDVRLFTARASETKMFPIMNTWLKEHKLDGMKITREKDFGMSQYWDEQGVHVVSNRGEIVAKIVSMVPERKYP